MLAIVGAGHQAHPHIAAMLEARQFEDIRIPSRSRESAERLAADWPLAERSTRTRRRCAAPT